MAVCEPGFSALVAGLPTVPMSTLAQAGTNVLILTDASTSASTGATHVSSLITAFTNSGATVVVNSSMNRSPTVLTTEVSRCLL
jgi:hypothetical protein